MPSRTATRRTVALVARATTARRALLAGASSGASSNDSNVSDMRPQQPANHYGLCERRFVFRWATGLSGHAGYARCGGRPRSIRSGALGVSYATQGSQYGVYVSSIGASRRRTRLNSGWGLLCERHFANTSASNYALADSDTVQWVYSVSRINGTPAMQRCAAAGVCMCLRG